MWAMRRTNFPSFNFLKTWKKIHNLQQLFKSTVFQTPLPQSWYSTNKPERRFVYDVYTLNVLNPSSWRGFFVEFAKIDLK